jgi:CRP/FNR family transcriptional regulator
MPAAPARFSLADCLRTHIYFRTLSPDSLARLSQAAVQRIFAAGEVIFLEGDPPAGLWVIERGRVKVFKISPDGREHILRLLGPGESFNDASAFDGAPNPASAAALSGVIAWVLAADLVQGLLAADPDMALAVIRGLSARMRLLVQQIEDLALYAVPARLARFLLAQSETPSLQGPGITRVAIAAHLATTPETVSRALRMLEETGAIRFDRHRIVIVDIDLLREIALL